MAFTDCMAKDKARLSRQIPTLSCILDENADAGGGRHTRTPNTMHVSMLCLLLLLVQALLAVQQSPCYDVNGNIAGRSAHLPTKPCVTLIMVAKKTRFMYNCLLATKITKHKTVRLL
jgi:hypothetical protein